MRNRQQELLNESLQELTNLKAELKLITPEVNTLNQTPPCKRADVRYLLNSLVINVEHAEQAVQTTQQLTVGIPILGTVD
ncbi:hypothetical protein [uncultured Lentilactobacillus sp.]|uniref:hypothetical protein n=1 Tax=uncultured Lentilactobacillus sp. TaxID=2805375 RepID=UPI0025961B1C|nr:hypothetical protein [uncultured Lentilactobacillus sp.]